MNGPQERRLRTEKLRGVVDRTEKEDRCDSLKIREKFWLFRSRQGISVFIQKAPFDCAVFVAFWNLRCYAEC